MDASPSVPNFCTLVAEAQESAKDRTAQRKLGLKIIRIGYARQAISRQWGDHAPAQSSAQEAAKNSVTT
jgi:hypothetical protein